MKLLASTESKINKDKNAENVPHLEITELALINRNIVNNYYHRDSRVLYTFVPSKSFDQLLDKSFGQLLDISRKIYIFQNFQFRIFIYWNVIYWSNSKPFEIEDKLNIPLVISWNVKYKKRWDIQFNLEIEYL